MDGGQWIEWSRAGKPRQSFLRETLAAVRVWRERVRQRRALALLDDRMLSDIAISRCDVMRECAKPFWQP